MPFRSENRRDGEKEFSIMAISDISNEYLCCEGSQRLVVWLANRVDPQGPFTTSKSNDPRSPVQTIPEAVIVELLNRLKKPPPREFRTDGTKEAYIERLAYDIIPLELRCGWSNPIEITPEKVNKLIEATTRRNWIEWIQKPRGWCLRRTPLGEEAWEAKPPQPTIDDWRLVVPILLKVLYRAKNDPSVAGDPRLMGKGIKEHFLSVWLSHLGVAKSSFDDALETIEANGLVSRSKWPFLDRLTGRMGVPPIFLNLRGETAALAGARWEFVARGVTEAKFQAQYVFRRSGEIWEVCFESERVQLKHVKGLELIQFLLRYPNSQAPFPAIFLMKGNLSQTNLVNSFQEVMDNDTKRNIEERFNEIEEQIAEATQLGDLGRVESLQNEQRFLAAELGKAFGLGGEACNLAGQSSGQLARAAVARRRDIAFRKIKQFCPRLFEHLKSSICTEGVSFAYRPVLDLPWQFD